MFLNSQTRADVSILSSASSEPSTIPWSAVYRISLTQLGAEIQVQKLLIDDNAKKYMDTSLLLIHFHVLGQAYQNTQNIFCVLYKDNCQES